MLQIQTHWFKIILPQQNASFSAQYSVLGFHPSPLLACQKQNLIMLEYYFRSSEFLSSGDLSFPIIFFSQGTILPEELQA